MNLETFTRDERAVSPVVGVALLIAMTVILAAVIAMVVLGLGAGMAEAPQATIQFEVTNGGADLTIQHDGGDRLDGDDVGVIVDGAAWTPLGTDLTAGNSEVLTGEGNAATVRVVWQDPNSDSESVIARYDA